MTGLDLFFLFSFFLGGRDIHYTKQRLDLFGIQLNTLSLNVALLDLNFGLTLGCFCYKVLSFWVLLCSPIFLSLLVWHSLVWHLGCALCKLAGLNDVVFFLFGLQGNPPSVR